MAGGDFSNLTWSNNNSPYINESNLQQYDDKLVELDENLRRDKTFHFGTYKKSMYQRNSKEIESFRTASDFADLGTSATISADTTNYIMNTQSLKVLENDNSAGYVSAGKAFSSTIDLTKFIDGSSSSTSDCICFIIYVSDSTKVNTVYLALGDDASNVQYIGYSGASLSNGWNVLTPQKSDFSTGGSPTGWDTIDYIKAEWYSNASAQNAYISFQFVQLVREDSVYSTYMNHFQLNDGSNFANEFTIVSDYYCMYNDEKRNEVGFFKINPDNEPYALSISYLNCLSFTSKWTFQCVIAGELPSVTWLIDTDNYITVYVTSDTLYLYLYESASGTTNSIALNTSLNIDDIINITFEKNDAVVRVIFESEGTITELNDITTLTSDAGDIYIGTSSTDSFGLCLDFVVSPNVGMLLPTKERWFKQKKTDETRTSDTSMSNDNELFVFLEANSLYRIHCRVAARGNSTGGIKIDWVLSGTAEIIAVNRKCIGMAYGETDRDNCNVRCSIHNIDTDVSYGIEASSNAIFEEFMIRTYDGYGKVQMRWAQQVSNGTATYVTSSSYILTEKF